MLHMLDVRSTTLHHMTSTSTEASIERVSVPDLLDTPKSLHFRKEQRSEAPMSQLTKLYKLSAPLQGLLGKSELSRPAAVKELCVLLASLSVVSESGGWLVGWY